MWENFAFPKPLESSNIALPTHCIMSGLSDCWEMLRVGENTQSHAQRGKALPGFENVCVYIPVMNWLIFHHHLQNKNVKIMDELLHIIDQVNTPASLQKKKKTSTLHDWRGCIWKWIYSLLHYHFRLESNRKN